VEEASAAKMLRRALALAMALATLCSAHAGAALPLLLGSAEQAARLPLRGARGGRAMWRAAPAGQHGGELRGLSLQQGIAMMGTRRAAGRPRAVLRGTTNATLLPDAYDVRDSWWRCSAVSRVMNQGPCGSCYAVASADTLSASICIQSSGDDDLVFSAQDMLSCSKNMRCLGGTIPGALAYLCEHGAAQESCVTYRAGDSWDHGHHTDACRHTCEMDQLLVRRAVPRRPAPEVAAATSGRTGGGGDGAGRHGSADCSSNYRLLADENAVKEAIMNVGPVVAYIDAYRSLVH